VRRAGRGGAVACHIHGGVMDHLVAHGSAGDVAGAIALIRSLGMKAGIAGHVPAVFEWAEKHLDVDYYMCCHYNPTRGRTTRSTCTGRSRSTARRTAGP